MIIDPIIRNNGKILVIAAGRALHQYETSSTRRLLPQQSAVKMCAYNIDLVC